MSGPRPKKGLGQNFLADKRIASEIIDSIDPKSGDKILEIGPGRGTLTVRLLDMNADVYAVEIDERLLEPLRVKFNDRPNFHLIYGDFLKLSWDELVPDVSFQLVGNLPYHITSSVLFRCLDTIRNQRNNGEGVRYLQNLTLMVQKEVGYRIVAQPGSSDYGILSIFCALECLAEIVIIVPAEAFYPPPKVDGAVIRFTPHKRNYQVTDYEILNKLIRGAFSVRRKMLRNSLKTVAGIHPFWQELDFDFSRRPETVTLEEWITLANAISDIRNH